jgi:uncharacterized membrane protein YdjX (TVP38/TMEM64 family)
MFGFKLQNSFFSKNRSTFVYLLLIAILQVFLTSSLVAWVLFHADTLQSFAWFQWLAVYIGFAVLMAVSVLPNSFVAFLGGFFLNFWALPCLLGSYGFSLCLGFWICRQVDGGNFAQSLQNLPQTKKILGQLQKDEWLLILLARISPILPFAFVNQILYSTGVKFGTFLWASMLGVLPRMVLMIWLGKESAQLVWVQDHENWYSWQHILQVSLILISIFGVSWLLKKAVTKAKM